MIAAIQRCKQASVTVDSKIVGKIGNGLVILLGVFQDDNEEDADFLVSKITRLRIFSDSAGKMNLSIQDISGSMLIISQFTLCGDWRKGRRPSFIKAADPEKGEALYEYFIDKVKTE